VIAASRLKNLVDVNHDGVCDCLKIATIGRAGVWGSSTLFALWLMKIRAISARE
jgi:hypothetical protein